ncbi:putative ribonuclease H-like domain-containing protein [Tanacetum coccineum]
MDDPNITMEEYIRLEEEKARKYRKVFNWETAKYGKIWYDDNVHDLRFVETEFPAIVFNDNLTSNETLSCEPMVSSLNNNEIEFRISFDESDDEDYMVVFVGNKSSSRVNTAKIRMQRDKYGIIDQVLGSTSGIIACALRNFNLGVMELENTQNNALAKLLMLKLGEVPIPLTTPPESGTSTTIKMTVPATIEEKTCKKNDVKARSLLLMALPNEHQLTFDQYVDAQSMFAAIKARFGGNEPTKKTQKALLKQQRSNVKILRSLPSEWDTHVVVWMNKHDFDTMGLDDLYNNFKIVEQKVKKSAGASNDDKNLAFVTTSGASSTNNINTVNPEVSTATTKVNTASTKICTASFSDATVFSFLSTQPKGSQLVHEDLEQLHDDDLEEMDLKWNMALLSMRARKFYQRTGRKIIIDGSNTAGYDKSKVECFNCHKMGHFAKERRAPRSKDNRN